MNLSNITQNEEVIEHNRKEERIVWIDLLKVIAIFFVLLYHGAIYSTDIASKNANIETYCLYFLKTILSTSVPIFFFVNGFLLFNKELNLKKHIIKTIKLILLAIIWGVIVLILTMVITNQYMTIKEAIKALWKWKTGWINYLWFIGSLVCIYIFFPVLKIAYDKNKKVFIYFIVVCVILTFGNAILNEIATLLNNTIKHSSKVVQGFNFFNIFNPFREIYGYTFVYFCFGGLMKDIIKKIIEIPAKKRNIIAIIVLILSCLCLTIMGVYYSKISNKTWDVVWNGYDTIFTFLNVIFIFILCLNYKKDYKLIKIISYNALGIYFIHNIFIRLTKPYITNYPQICNLPVNLVYIFIILCISLVVCLLIKKIPILKKLI